ncbi:MAG: hypothetical protein KGJ06_01270 [Pseudomonadota bacterium]|nr:hypothetical protein [Pseudomonadota bacterium]
MTRNKQMVVLVLVVFSSIALFLCMRGGDTKQTQERTTLEDIQFKGACIKSVGHTEHSIVLQCEVEEVPDDDAEKKAKALIISEVVITNAGPTAVWLDIMVRKHPVRRIPYDKGFDGNMTVSPFTQAVVGLLKGGHTLICPNFGSRWEIEVLLGKTTK